MPWRQSRTRSVSDLEAIVAPKLSASWGNVLHDGRSERGGESGAQAVAVREMCSLLERACKEEVQERYQTAGELLVGVREWRSAHGA